MKPLPALAPGLWCVLPTPFTASLAVDEASLERLLGRWTSSGAAGLVALGVFGEAAALDSDEQRRVVETVAGTTPGTPVVVGLAARTTAVALEQAAVVVRAAGDQLAALMVQAHSSDPSVLVEHLTRLHESTGHGLVLQDYPFVSGVTVSSDHVLQVLDSCPFVVAVKAESPPTPLAIARLAGGTSVPVFGGLGGVGLIDELACGAAGAMTGFSHPEGLRETLDAWRDGGFEAARSAWERWLPLATFEGQPGIGLALRKQVLYHRGILASPTVRPPARACPPELLPLLEQHLATIPTPYELED